VGIKVEIARGYVNMIGCLGFSQDREIPQNGTDK